MDYIYAELNNKLKATENKVEYKPTNIDGSDTAYVVSDGDNSYKVSVNTSNLVRIIPIQKDYTPGDDVKQTFRLVAYNTYSGQFDIPLGDDIVIDHTHYNSVNPSSISKAIVGGVEIPARVNESGQLILDFIPAAAIQDTYYVKQDNGGYKEVQIESFIDGND